MKIEKLLHENLQIKPWQFTTEKVAMDQKGRVAFLHPELRGENQCPFWKTLKSKIAANIKESADDIKVPKSFATETAKSYKIPLDQTYVTPMCISSNKTCSFFRGVSEGSIVCDFKAGGGKGTDKKVPIEGTKQEVPAASKAEAPVKETTAKTAAIPAPGLTDSRPGNYPYDDMSETKCKKCGKPQKENTDGNQKYCQGH